MLPTVAFEQPRLLGCSVCELGTVAVIRTVADNQGVVRRPVVYTNLQMCF